MRGGHWWLHLLVLEAANSWRMHGIQRTLLLSLWFVPVILAPLVLVVAGNGLADAALDWLLSFDMPMALILSAQAGSAIGALASRVDTENWVSPKAARGMAGRALFLTRVIRALRWPVGLALAAALLSLGSEEHSARTIELQVIALSALVGGAALAWLLLGNSREAARAAPAAAARGQGLSVLSGVALSQTRRRLNLRRLSLLTVPVLLAAPMSAQAQEVLRMLGAWLVLIFLMTWVRQATLAGAAMRRWMPRMQMSSWHLTWVIWSRVVVGALLCVVVLWLGWRVTAPQGSVLQP